MKVLVVRPMEMPAVQEIDHTLSAMQELVGGTIQAVYPFDDPVALVCNDEGKLLGLPWNRALTDDHGVPYDIVCGTFFVVGIGDEDFTSLTEQQIEKYRKKYANEMVFSVPVPFWALSSVSVLLSALFSVDASSVSAFSSVADVFRVLFSAASDCCNALFSFDAAAPELFIFPFPHAATPIRNAAVIIDNAAFLFN